MNITQHTAETLVTKTATAAQYGGSASAAVFGLTSSEWNVIGVIGGLLIAAAGFLVNLFYKHQHLQLAKSKLAEDFYADE